MRTLSTCFACTSHKTHAVPWSASPLRFDAQQDPLSWMSRGIASPLAHDPKVMLVIVSTPSHCTHASLGAPSEPFCSRLVSFDVSLTCSLRCVKTGDDRVPSVHEHNPAVDPGYVPQGKARIHKDGCRRRIQVRYRPTNGLHYATVALLTARDCRQHLVFLTKNCLLCYRSGRLRQSLGGSIQERASMDGSLKTSSTYSQIGSGHRPGTY